MRLQERGGVSDETTTVEAFDPADFPAAGTACVRCKRSGHFCGAKGYAGDDALCLACGSGLDCEQRAAVIRLAERQGCSDGELDPHGLHGECRTVALEEVDSYVEAPAASSAWQRFKATLSTANLRSGIRSGLRSGPRSTQAKAEREKKTSAGRRKAMSGVTARVEMLSEGLEDSGALCSKSAGCNRPAGHSGRHVGGGGVAGGESAYKPAKRGVDIEIISVTQIPREHADVLASRLREIEPGEAVRVTSSSAISTGRIVNAAAAACADLPGLNIKRCGETAYLWFVG